MPYLNADERRAIASCIRQYLKVVRELSSTRALLALCEREKLYPQNWQQTLETMKTLPAYKILPELDIVAGFLDQSADEIDLTELLSKLPKETRPN